MSAPVASPVATSPTSLFPSANKLAGILRAFTSAAICSVLSAALFACAASSPTGNPVTERYQYAADQVTPYSAQLSGTLSITNKNGDRFDGSLDVLLTSNTGLVARRTGIVHGRISAGAMDFDAMLEGDVYRHVGRAGADSVSGSWLDASAIGNVSSGTFRLARKP